MYFCHLSDTHIMAETNALLYGVNPYQRLQQALAQIAAFEPPPAFVILTGDLINDDNPQSYRHLKQLTDCSSVPTYFALGNHDLRRPFRQILRGETPPEASPYYYAFETAGYRFIVLDSLVEGEVRGTIDAAQLSWLADTLAAKPSRPTVVFVHHAPVPIGVEWLDAHVITNGVALLEVLSAHTQVRQVCFGHVHMPVHMSVHGILCTSAPSTGYQFGDARLTPKVSPGPAAYGLVRIQETYLSSRVVYF